jgi:hypothetical protein
MTTMTSIDVLPRRVVYGKYDEREAFSLGVRHPSIAVSGGQFVLYAIRGIGLAH